jgi:CRISPR system Cascade subunit CasC
MSERTYVDVHVLQTVPPSNLNRDDAGSPKQAMYGGVRRARVSSQAWKRATRTAFEGELHLPRQVLGTRTKRISTLLAQRLTELQGVDSAAAVRLSNALLKDLNIAAGKKEAETAYLLFFGYAQLDAIANLIDGRADELAALDDDALAKTVADLPVREQLTSGHPIDVALFGRMVADLPALNVDAATQVAHALSTHGTEIEFDYYTAVDDEKDTRLEDAGAAMIGTVEFTSATLYRYATVGMHQLVANLGGDHDAAIAGLEAFIAAFTRSMPTGHQNTFAHHTVPSLLSVIVRADQPVNLVSAFESPIVAGRQGGIAAASARRLAEELSHTATAWALTPELVASQYKPAGDEAALRDAFGPSLEFKQVVSAAAKAVRSRLTSQSVA